MVERTRLQHNSGAQNQKPADARAILRNHSTRSYRVPKFIRDTAKLKTGLKVKLVDIVKSKQFGKIETENVVKHEIKPEIPRIEAAPRRSERLRTKPRIKVVFKAERKSEKKTGRKSTIIVQKIDTKVKQEPLNTAFETFSPANTVLEESPSKSTSLMPKNKEYCLPSFLARRTNLPKKKELSETEVRKNEVATDAFEWDHSYSRANSVADEGN